MSCGARSAKKCLQLPTREGLDLGQAASDIDRSSDQRSGAIKTYIPGLDDDMCPFVGAGAGKLRLVKLVFLQNPN